MERIIKYGAANIIKYLNVCLSQNKSTGPHEVDFVIGNKID